MPEIEGYIQVGNRMTEGPIDVRQAGECCLQAGQMPMNGERVVALRKQPGCEFGQLGLKRGLRDQRTGVRQQFGRHGALHG